MNRCKGTWVAGAGYWKHTLGATQRYLNSTLQVWTKVKWIWAQALINTGATVNFMSSGFVKRVNITLKNKGRESFTVQNINKNLLNHNHEKIDQEIKKIRLQIESHINEMRFNIMTTGINDIVLEVSWLKEFDSNISFRC